MIAWQLGAGSSYAQKQVVDPDFDASVATPAYESDGPTVAIDAGHGNFHTAEGQYKPFADLLRNDGYDVISCTRRFEGEAFEGIDVLVLANAKANGSSSAAFTAEECDAIRDWVRAGGSLLLVADHAPFGRAAEELGRRFDVAMGNGWVYEPKPDGTGVTTQLVYSRENGLLGEHPILRGRSAAEEVKSVRSFTGQSLGVPDGAVALLELGPKACEAPTTGALDAAHEAAATKEAPQGDDAVAPPSVGDRAQAVAIGFGKGRVVILGEAAMFSAQVVTLPDGDRERVIKAGMNVPGYDDRQFALNVMHWLSGALK